MQVSRFTNGGFVLHRVEGRYSCWYDKDGVMLDCESFSIKRRISRSWAIKRDSATWQRLAKLGPIWRDDKYAMSHIIHDAQQPK